MSPQFFVYLNLFFVLVILVLGSIAQRVKNPRYLNIAKYVLTAAVVIWNLIRFRS